MHVPVHIGMSRTCIYLLWFVIPAEMELHIDTTQRELKKAVAAKQVSSFMRC